MRICVIMMPIVGFQVVSIGYFLAVGKPRESMLVSLSRQLLFLIPAVLILPNFMGLNGVWAAIPTADLSSSILAGALLFLELRHLGNHRRISANIRQDRGGIEETVKK